MVIDALNDVPHFAHAVADRIWQAWWRSKGVPLAEIAGRVRQSMTDEVIPLAFVAHDGDAFLGTASLIPSDLDERPLLSPWVAAVWVEPAARSQGVGRDLVACAAEAAFARGAGRVYLCAAPNRRSYYVELGWTVLEDAVGTRSMTVFVRQRTA